MLWGTILKAFFYVKNQILTEGGETYMANTNIKGIWLPIDILINSELNDKEKIVLSLILFFSREKGGYKPCRNPQYENIDWSKYYANY